MKAGSEVVLDILSMEIVIDRKKNKERKKMLEFGRNKKGFVEHNLKSKMDIESNVYVKKGKVRIGKKMNY